MKLINNKNLINITLVNILLGVSSYIVLPILPLYLHETLNFTIVSTSILLTLPLIVSICLAFCTPYFIRRVGIFYALVVNVITRIFYISALLYIKEYFWLIVISIFYGVLNSYYNTIIKLAYMKFEKDSGNAFRLRYISICIAALIGPFLVILFSEKFAIELSIICCVICLIILLLNKNAFNLFDYNVISTNKGKAKVDPAFLIVLIGGFLFFTFFSQFENVFSITLRESKIYDNPTKTFSYLLILNSVCAIFYQLVIIKFFNKIHTINLIIIGNIAFASSFLIFYYFNQSIFSLIIGVIIYSLGEALTIPCIDTFAKEKSNKDNITLNFGLLELIRLGFVFGPIFASFLIQYFNYRIMFLIFICIILISCLIFYIAEKFIKTKII